MAKTAYQLWQEDQDRKKQEADKGNINFKEASRASRVQYSLPGYQGHSKDKNYSWETETLKDYKAKGVRSYNDKFSHMTKQMGMSESQADEYRRFMDFQEDRNQKYKLNKDGSPNQSQSIRAGQGAHLQSEILDGIFNNMQTRQFQDLLNNQKRKAGLETQPIELAKIDKWDKFKNLLGIDLSEEKQNTLQAKRLGLDPKSKQITADEWNEANQLAKEKAIEETSKERPGLLGVLDSFLGRTGQASHKYFDVQSENENYRNNAVDRLRNDPTDKNAIATLQMLNTNQREAKNGLEKTADFLGAATAELAPYTVGNAYGVANKGLQLINKLKTIKNPVVQDLVRGVMAGTIAGTEKAGVQTIASDRKYTAEELAKEIGTEAAFAGGGDALLGGVLRNINLKGQLGKLLDETGSKQFNEQEFKQALEEAFAPKGNVSNVLADQTPVLPKPFETKYPNLTSQPKTMDSFTTNEIPKVEEPLIDNDWFNFAQSGQGPVTRGAIPKVNVSRGDKELLGNQAEQILQRFDALGKAPDGGFNQRLLDVQNSMKAINDKRGIYRQELSPDDLYKVAKHPNDPATFDDLIKLAELENNAANAPKNLKNLLRDDPKVNDGIRKLNELLGNLPKKSAPIVPNQPNVNFDEGLSLLGNSTKGVPVPKAQNQKTISQAFEELNNKYKGKGKNSQEAALKDLEKIYEEYTPLPDNLVDSSKLPVPNNANPLEKLQEFLNSGKKTAPANTGTNQKLTMKDLFQQLSGKPAPEPKVTKEIVAASKEPVALKSVKPTKDVNAMSKEELQSVRQELAQQQQSLSKSKSKTSKQKLQAIQEDIEKVDGLLMKLDLQLFGKNEPKPNPVNASEHQIKSDAQEYAIDKSRQENLVKKYEKKGKQEKVEIAKLLENTDDWKDKGKFFLGRETMERNFEDIMGADAPVFKEKFLDPVKSKEAERVRFLNKERDLVKSYEIKPKSLDDQLVQMYGEKKISLEELKEKTPNWEKVVEVSEAYRKKYDELLDIVNKKLKTNGFSEIPKRQDYFPHYEEVDSLMKQFGFDMNNNALPTDINGLTDTFKPSKTFFNHALRRKGEETTFGAIQGFDRYIEGVSNLIYHTKNIKQLRNLEEVIRNKYAGDTHLSNFAAELGEYTNLLAGKKAKVDRAFEDRFGRSVYNAVDTIRRKVGANMIGLNLASAMTNYIPLTQSLATTNKTAFVKGMTETLANVVKNDGFIQKSDFLTKRFGSDPLFRTNWDKIVDKSMWFMKTSDAFVSQAITRGKYNELISKGTPEKKAIKQADDYATRIMAARSKGEMPTLFGSKTLGIVSQFQLEVNNQISVLFKDIPKNAKNKVALASAMGQVLVYSYMFNEAYEMAVGRRPAFDPIGMAFQAKKDYTNDKFSKGEATQRTIENSLNNLPFTSLLNGGRFPISASIPNMNDAMNGRSPWTKELTKPLIYLGLPAGGGQLKKTYDGLTAMAHNPLSSQETTGVYQNGKLKIPVNNNVPNNIRGPLFGQYSFPETREYYDINNRPQALSKMQTKAYERLEKEKEGLGKELYNYLRIAKTKPYDKAKITKVEKNEDLSDAEKIQRMIEILANAKK